MHFLPFFFTEISVSLRLFSMHFLPPWESRRFCKQYVILELARVLLSVYKRVHLCVCVHTFVRMYYANVETRLRRNITFIWCIGKLLTDQHVCISRFVGNYLLVFSINIRQNFRGVLVSST